MFLPDGVAQAQSSFSASDANAPSSPQASQADIALMQRVLAAASQNPNLIPADFMSYVLDWIQTQRLEIPIGQVPGYSQFVNNAIANATFLSGARVHNSTTQPVANTGTWTVLSFDTEDLDTGTYHDPSVNPSRLTAPSTGMYLLAFNYLYVIPGTYNVGIRFRKNGSTVLGEYETSDAAVSISFTVMTYLTTGDYVEVLVEQQSSTNPLAVDVITDVSPYFSIARQG
jgi:hypothetical protein